MKRIKPGSLFVQLHLLAAFLSSFSGCNFGSELAPVSGKVTADGAPVAGVRIVFYPKPTEDNPAPGPFAEGETDDQGRFTLVSRDVHLGACVGVNQIRFQLPNASKSELQGAQSALRLLKGNPQQNRAEIKQMEEKVEKIRAIHKQFAMIDPKYLTSSSIEVIVPSDGLENHEIDISKR